jgi:GT2 family glycosyltransferase
MKHTDISVIIVNYNTEKYLEKCICSVEKYSGTVDYEIIVVDNKSGSGLLEELARILVNHRFIFNEENFGFGRACNIGSAEASGKYLLFLNPDIILKDNVLEKLKNILDSNSDISVCGGLLKQENGEPNISFNKFPDLSWEIREAFGISVGKAIKDMIQKVDIPGSREFEVDWISGADLMVRKDIFDSVGGFDDKIFLYYEDVDLQKRIRDIGGKIICLPSANLFHYERSSVRTNTANTVYYYNMHKSKLYYMKKHKSFIYVFLIRVIWVSGTVSKIFALPFRKLNKEVKKIKMKEYVIILKVHLGLGIG